MRSLDELYWDSRCTPECGCKSLLEALERHPELRREREEEPKPVYDPQENFTDLES